MKVALSSLVLAWATLVVGTAHGQELGSKGDVVFSAERLMGITGNHQHVEVGGVGSSTDSTAISFGWRRAATPFEIPRLGFDYLVVDHLSIGGSLGYASLDPDPGESQTMFLFAPRIGYLYSFSHVIAIWPRGGFTYHSTSAGNDYDDKGFALDLECPFTFSPAAHFAFQIGPSFDVDLFGDSTRHAGNVDVKNDLTYRSFGLNAGLLGWF